MLRGGHIKSTKGSKLKSFPKRDLGSTTTILSINYSDYVVKHESSVKRIGFFDSVKL